ncbi:DUF262 domain-containing protein [Planctomonas deserti]|uniref:DUF262 domain-containing protein n=1 Tax=Planctomonas deserti TaxID=2144185 RepID=UPI000D3412A1|nr:DUF262 domain-containing protein [Planctomonas deserti]
MANSSNFLNTSHQTLAWFAEQNDAGTLDLRPGFQRRPVWVNEEKAFLIDSVLRGYPVPEVYVQSIDDGLRQVVAVVDGQQRLRACLEFMADAFAVTFDTNKLAPLHSLADTPWFSKKFSQLTETERLRIRKYKLIVRDLEDAEDKQVRHLFHRLNQSNVALNAQELRYSIYQGGLLAAVESLVKHKAWDHIRMFTKLQQRRMLDSEYVSELVIGHLHFPQNKKDDLDEYYRRYAAGLPGADAVLEVFNRSLNALVDAFPLPHMDRTRWYRKSDFYTLLLMITRGQIPLVDGSIAHIKSRLVEFSDLVSAPPRDGEPLAVSTYRESVERAATDRGRRMRREEALLAFLNDADLSEASTVPLPVDDEEDTDSLLEQEYEDVPLS